MIRQLKKHLSFASVTASVTASIVTIVSFYFLRQLLSIMNRGYDFTDEGYYLNWISNPWLFPAEISQFGYVYYPLYILFEGDIASLRKFNILISYALALGVAFCALRTERGSRSEAETTLVRVSIAAGVAASSSLLLALWLPTPNYNSLALQSILIFASGMLLTRSIKATKRFAGWQMLSLGTFLAFTAKPTTGIALTLLAVAYAVSTGRFRIIDLISGALLATGMSILFAWASYGSVAALATSFVASLDNASTLSDRFFIWNVIRYDSIPLNNFDYIVIFCIGLSISVSFLARRVQNGVLIATLVTALFLIMGCAQILSSVPIGTFLGPNLALLVLAVPLNAILLLVTRAFRQDLADAFAGIDWQTAIVFLFLPPAFVFGTGSNYWMGAVGAGVFWVLAGLILMNGRNIPLVYLLPASTFAQALTIIVTAVSIDKPYRQSEPLTSQHAKFEYGPNHSLFISSDAHRYLVGLRSAALANGFRPGDGVLDLTGHYPGALFALEAKPLGRPWIIGGYEGSRKLAVRVLSAMPCDQLASAWLLVEPGGPREISTEILHQFGLSAERDYISTAPIRSVTKNEDGYFDHHLLRPIEPTKELCHAVEDEKMSDNLKELGL